MRSPKGERTNEMVDYVLANGPTERTRHWQHDAVVKMMDEQWDCELCEIVSVRAVLHFVHLWKRNARMKVLRRKARQHVIMVCGGRQLPWHIGANIYAFAR